MSVISQLQGRLASTIGLLCMTSAALAYAPLTTDDAGTVGYQTTQIELYGNYIRDHGAVDTRVDASGSFGTYEGTGPVIPTTLVYMRGLTEALDLYLGATYFRTPTGGFSPIANYNIGVKWRLYGDGENKFSFTFKPQIIFPATNTQQNYGLGNAALNYGALAIASYFWDNAELHANAGYMRAPYNTTESVKFSTDPNRTNLYSLSIAPVWRVTSEFKLALDTGINTNPAVADQSLINYVMLAAIYTPVKSVDIGVSVQRFATNMGTIFSGSGSYTNRFQAGITWRYY